VGENQTDHFSAALETDYKRKSTYNYNRDIVQDSKSNICLQCPKC